MNHQELINTCIFEQIQGLLFSDLSGPLRYSKQHFAFSLSGFNNFAYVRNNI